MAQKRVSLGCLLLAMVLQGCEGDGGDSSGQAVLDSAGVTIVRTSSQDVPLAWEVEQLWRVGGVDDGPTAFSQLLEGSLASTPSGGLAVLDRAARRVVDLSSTGEVERVLGREGQGPGEFTVPVSVAVLGDGSTWVYDLAKGGVVRFGADGESMSDLRIPAAGRSSVIRPGAEGVVKLQSEAVGDSLAQVLVHFGAAGPLDSLGVGLVPSPGRVELPGCGLAVPMAPVFSPRLLWDASGARVATTIGPNYEIAVYEGGELAVSLRRSLEPSQATAALAEDRFPDGFSVALPGGSCEVQPGPLVRARGFADLIPLLANLRMAPSGELWVLREALGSQAQMVDVWTPAGEYLGTLPEGFPFPAAFLLDGSLVTVELDELDVPSVVAWSVVR